MTAGRCRSRLLDANSAAMVALLLACDEPSKPPVSAEPSRSSAVTAAPPGPASATSSASAAATHPPAAPQRPIRRTLDCGNYFGCTITQKGKVACWGFNQFGQLGSGKLPYPRKARAFVEIPPAAVIAVGLTHACAVTTTGEVHCWGAESSGAIGDGKVDGPDAPTPRIVAPSKVALAGKAVDVDVAVDYSCAVLEDGTAHCWGDNRSRVMAIADAATGTPEPIDGVRDAVEIATGDDEACVRTLAGSVSCWGARSSTTPTPVAGLCARQLGLSLASACAVSCEGAVSCWGALPGYGNEAPSPKVQPAFGAAVEIRAGLGHYIARDASGRVTTWGSNDSGQIGNGKPPSWDQAYADDPVHLSTEWKAEAVCAGGITARPDGRPYLRPSTFVDTGASCARTEAGEVYCWGEPDIDYAPKKVTLPR